MENYMFTPLIICYIVWFWVFQPFLEIVKPPFRDFVVLLHPKSEAHRRPKKRHSLIRQNEKRHSSIQKLDIV